MTLYGICLSYSAWQALGPATSLQKGTISFLFIVTLCFYFRCRLCFQLLTFDIGFGSVRSPVVLQVSMPECSRSFPFGWSVCVCVCVCVCGVVFIHSNQSISATCVKLTTSNLYLCFLGSSEGRLCLQCRWHKWWGLFDPWGGKIPWKREWQPMPVFLLWFQKLTSIWRVGELSYSTHSAFLLNKHTFFFFMVQPLFMK